MLTVYGIETFIFFWFIWGVNEVATVLTVYGIETADNVLSRKWKRRCNSAYRLRYWNSFHFILGGQDLLGCNSAYRLRYWNRVKEIAAQNGCYLVATVLTVYGIETLTGKLPVFVHPDTLQQCLPFTVLKPDRVMHSVMSDWWLQQCLPFTVLKPHILSQDVG